MEINLNNYEAYFLDYHEGNLSTALVNELMGFLEKHPELREEFESFEAVTLKDEENITYGEKASLKKKATGINAENFDEYAVEYIEGTLPAPMLEELNVFIQQNPEYKKELELYAKTKLAPDSKIIFEDKQSLKRRKGRVAAVWYYTSAAASIAIVVGIYFLFNRGTVTQNVIKENQTQSNNVVAVPDTKRQRDTANSIVKAPVGPVVNPTKTNTVVINIHHTTQHTSEKSRPNNVIHDSSSIAVNKEISNNHIIQSSVAPDSTKNTVVTASDNHDTIYVPVIKYRLTGTHKTQVAAVGGRKKRGLLMFLASITCKGLHSVTGKRFEVEKHLDNDTGEIVAYQLDLGSKTIKIPINEQ